MYIAYVQQTLYNKIKIYTLAQTKRNAKQAQIKQS